MHFQVLSLRFFFSCCDGGFIIYWMATTTTTTTTTKAVSRRMSSFSFRHVVDRSRQTDRQHRLFFVRNSYRCFVDWKMVNDKMHVMHSLDRLHPSHTPGFSKAKNNKSVFPLIYLSLILIGSNLRRVIILKTTKTPEDDSQ